LIPSFPVKILKDPQSGKKEAPQAGSLAPLPADKTFQSDRHWAPTQSYGLQLRPLSEASEGTAGVIQALAGGDHLPMTALPMTALSGQLCGGSLIVSSDARGGRSR
jgi:hypothetical protein